MELSGFFDYLPLEGGDKPHHYEYSVTEKVGALDRRFIPPEN